jgi:hypothetical protein
MKFNPYKLDRRIIYLLVLLALALPIIYQYSIKAARMKSAESLYEVIEGLEPGPGDFAFIALDFGPNTQGENRPQAEVVIEHLMRRRIPVVLFSQYALAEPFLNDVPQRVVDRLEAENPGESWKYGRDWVNLGFRVGSSILIQGIPRAPDFAEFFTRDIRGNVLSELEIFSSRPTFKNLIILGQFTGLVGAFDTYVQFFQSREHRPYFTHGSTSITIPEAYIYLDSGQLHGLLEGLAGAAWYAELLGENFPNRLSDEIGVINTGLGIAQLLIMSLVIFGNVMALMEGRRLGKKS